MPTGVMGPPCHQRPTTRQINQGHHASTLLYKLLKKDWASKIFQKINNDCRMGRWSICDRHPDMLRPRDRNSKILPVWEIRVPSHRSNCFLDHQSILLSHGHKIKCCMWTRAIKIQLDWSDQKYSRHHSASVWIFTLKHLALLVSDVYDEEMVLIPLNFKSGNTTSLSGQPTCCHNTRIKADN